MKFAIVISKKDIAGMNISKELDNLKVDHILLEKETIYSDDVDQIVGKNIDFVIFATRHKAEKHSKTLTIHAPGNFHSADHGGVAGKVCRTSALFMKQAFKILQEENEKAKSGFQVSMECTHHGPLIEKPCCFIEIGSGEEEWNNLSAVKIIANTIKKAISEPIDEIYETAIGIGGPHYCPNFNKVQLNSKFAIGHVIPEYAFPVTKEFLKEVKEKTLEKTNIAILDWKGCGKSEARQKLIDLLKKENFQIERTDQIKK
jgi:D-aminoacyl-tRNA deacylase